MFRPVLFLGVDGWFAQDCADFYAARVEDASSGAHFVEIGSWAGRSATAMAESIRESGKAITFDCVDTWAGSAAPSEQDIYDAIRRLGKPSRVAFEENLRRNGLWEFVSVAPCGSPAAAALYRDGTLDFVFIDGNHSFEAVRDDVSAWLPKVRSGGMIAGHDWNQHTAEAPFNPAVFQVTRGVLACIPVEKVNARGALWWHRKESR